MAGLGLVIQRGFTVGQGPREVKGAWQLAPENALVLTFPFFQRLFRASGFAAEAAQMEQRMRLAALIDRLLDSVSQTHTLSQTVSSAIMPFMPIIGPASGFIPSTPTCTSAGGAQVGLG
jgi:hypothetical protein